MTDARQLERALDLTHAALLNADFGQLRKIVEETEAVLARLQGMPDKTTADRLRQKANRNAHCLLAAGRGLRAAQRRLVETAGNTAGLSTYTSRGQRSELGIAPGSLTQRL